MKRSFPRRRGAVAVAVCLLVTSAALGGCASMPPPTDDLAVAAAAIERAEDAQQVAQQATAETERLRREREAARQATAELEADLAALQAERTQRALVVTLGNDVLFDVGRAALVSRGIGADGVATVGHGEQYAIASSSNPGGRQLNRRVEVVISDESGRIASR
ncbi:MAG: hypothetical protein O9284_12465 [Steroidobacteraceae bacterium]|jgi:outer membrane protein OmpA-like peptidoglycan-associated protein|nr:hypothetical protein [Steroidobacteraceae bacterium]